MRLGAERLWTNPESLRSTVVRVPGCWRPWARNPHVRGRSRLVRCDGRRSLGLRVPAWPGRPASGAVDAIGTKKGVRLLGVPRPVFDLAATGALGGRPLMSGQASLCPFRVPSRRSVPSGCCRDPAGLRARGGVVRFSQRPAGPSQVVAGTSMRASSADPPCPVDTTERRAPADARHRGTSPGSCVCVWCGACQCGAVQCSRGPPCYLCAGRWLARTSLSCGSFPRPTRERRLGPARWRRGRLELACVYSKPSVGPVLGRRVAGSLRRSWTPKNGVPPRRPPSIGGCRPRAPQGAFRGAPRVVCPKTPEDSGMLSPLDYRTRWTGRPARRILVERADSDVFAASTALDRSRRRAASQVLLLPRSKTIEDRRPSEAPRDTSLVARERGGTS